MWLTVQPEVRGDMFLRNCTALHLCSSLNFLSLLSVFEGAPEKIRCSWYIQFTTVRRSDKARFGKRLTLLYRIFTETVIVMLLRDKNIITAGKQTWGRQSLCFYDTQNNRRSVSRACSKLRFCLQHSRNYLSWFMLNKQGIFKKNRGTNDTAVCFAWLLQ
jgi:hypothetical protein